MKSKILIIFFLLSLLSFNLYSSQKYPDKYTQAKTNFSSLIGSTSYLGRLNFWHLLVQNGDWGNAVSLEDKLNQDQVTDYKLNHQPQKLQQKLNQMESDNQKTTDSYIKLAQVQSLLGISQQAADSIKKAHQLDPVRSDVDKLFYSISE